MLPLIKCTLNLEIRQNFKNCFQGNHHILPPLHFTDKDEEKQHDYSKIT